MAQCCYIGRGKVYIQKHGTGCPTTLVPWTTPVIEVGNTESLNFEVSENVIEKKDYTSTAGGVDCSYSEIESVDLTMDTSCFKAQNLALALFGAQSVVAASVVTGEIYTVNSTSDFIAFAKKYDPAVAPVITDNPNTVTYVAGTDYTLTPNGIKIIPGGAIVAAQDIIVNYTSLEYINIEAVVQSSDYYKVIFDGVNAVDNQPLYLEVYKVKFNPSSLSFIADEFATVNLEGKVLKWECKTPSNTISAYAKIRI